MGSEMCIRDSIKPPIFGGNGGYFFGSAPDDRDSKMNHSWVNGGVKGPFGQAVKDLPFFTPAYDPLALLMAIDNLDDVGKHLSDKSRVTRNARRGGRRKSRKKRKKKKRKSKKRGKRKGRKTKRKRKKTKKRRR